MFSFKTLSAVLLLSLATPATSAPVEFWYSHTGAVAQAISELCEHFNASRIDAARVHCVHQGSYELTLQKTVAAYRGGQGPALVELYDVATADILQGNATHNAETIMAEQNLGYAANTFVPALRRYYAGVDGTLAAQPFAASTAVLYSHRDALAAAGISEPPQTWEAFAVALRALKEHGHSCPAVTDFAPWIWLEQTSATQGSAVISQANGAAGLTSGYRFDQGSHLRLMSDLADWYSAGWVRDQAATRSGLQTLAFANGDCALLLDSTGAWSAIRDAGVSDINVTVLPIYSDTERHASVPGGSAIWIMRGHTQQEYAVAAAFLAYVLQTANQLAFSIQTGYLPVTQSAADQMLQSTNRQNAVTVGLAALTDINGQPSPPLRCGFLSRLRLIWTQQLRNALAGRQTIYQALHQSTQRGNSLLALFQETYPDADSPDPGDQRTETMR
ncbi:extracellular solute-binding protein [Pseudomonas gingeri]|uniref:sn-glycerol-3-phosphate-binding periplasmic protein UgpB n=1 Tax=Pseudomonas gingeri TaxID=117681 RepID=A0A7Y7XBU2_9PSED|nr:extracellular solute-binding protein [Pseudomonas gingeri]NWB97028.1 extracellular solute-binding protein [Pseudomonas gingeri]